MANIPAKINYGKRVIRMIVINGIPKFSATDICNILGYVNPNKVLGRFCESAPEYVRMKTSGGDQTVRVISPDDIRDILRHSKRRNASRLKNWFETQVFPMFHATPRVTLTVELAAQ